MRNKAILFLTGVVLAGTFAAVFAIIGNAIVRVDNLGEARTYGDELLLSWVELESTTKDLLIKGDLSESREEWFSLIDTFEAQLEEFSVDPSILKLIDQNPGLASNVEYLNQLWYVTETNLTNARVALDEYLNERPARVYSAGILESFGSEKMTRKYSVSHRELVQILETCASISDESFNEIIRNVVSSVRSDIEIQFTTIRRGGLVLMGLVLGVVGLLIFLRVRFLTESRHAAQKSVAELQHEIEQRTAAENSLREREVEVAEANRMLHLVLDTIPVRVFWKDTELNYLGCNQLFANDAGRERPEDLIGDDDYTMGWSDQAELYRADDRGVIESGRPKFDYEEPQTTPDGNEVWLRTSKIPLRDTADNILGMLGVYEDISIRKQAERELKLRGEFETMLSEIATEFVGISAALVTDAVEAALARFAAVVDVDRITFFTHTFHDQRTYRCEWNREAKPAGTYDTDADVANSWPWVMSHLQEGLPVLVPKTANLPDDAEVDRETAKRLGIESFAFITVVQDSNIVASLGASTIGRERKWGDDFVQYTHIVGTLLVSAIQEHWAHADLRRSEERLNEAQQIAHVGSWEWDVETGARIWSDEMYEIYGVDKETFIANTETVREFVHPDDLHLVSSDIETTLGGHDRFEMEYRIVDKNDANKVVASNGRVIRNETGKVVRFFGTLQDITEKKAIDEELERHRMILEDLVAERTNELKEAQAELVKQERLATLGQLTATVSHELRNPLGTIRGSLYTVKERLKGTESTVAKPLERAERNITRCDNIIEELLDFTRTTQPLLGRTDMDKLLGEIVDEFRNSTNISIVCDLESGIDALVDIERFRRCIINVLTNAMDAIKDRDDVPDGGHLISVIATKKESRCELLIKDTGCGIAPEKREKIFEPLFSTKSFGVGLGLPIIKQIIEQHGGGIELDSQMGSGTTVTLWLPSVDASVEDGK
jgi:PAS domain S-box-containing protein